MTDDTPKPWNLVLTDDQMELIADVFNDTHDEHPGTLAYRIFSSIAEELAERLADRGYHLDFALTVTQCLVSYDLMQAVFAYPESDGTSPMEALDLIVAIQDQHDS